MKKYNFKAKASFLSLVLFFLISSPVEASVNGWMLEAMRMLEARNVQAEDVFDDEKDVVIEVRKEKSEEDDAQNRAVKMIKNILNPFSSENSLLKRDESQQNGRFFVDLGEKEIKMDYTIKAFQGNFKLLLASSTLESNSELEIVKLNEDMETPWRLKRISPIYQYEINNKEAYAGVMPLELEIGYDEEVDDYKEIFFFDGVRGVWRPLPSRDNFSDKYVQAKIHLPFARLAIFVYPKVLVNGKASWYKYKDGDYAASPDFAKGSIIKVTNLDNDKSINVTINDWGPERDLFPDRAIDLDKFAFKKISSLGAGIINVLLEPIYIASFDGVKLGLSEKGAMISPDIDSKAAIILSEEDGSVVYEKNATSTLSIASLTKLVSMKTFFETRPSLNRIVEYKDVDELNNHRYVDEPWRIAKMSLNEGDEITLEDLLYASLIGSSNNTVETLVRTSGLTRDKFVVLMNQNARKWGAKSTHFIEPTGLAPENISTALDYAIMTKELFRNPLIKKTSTMNKYRLKVINGDREYSVVNRNHLILKNTYRIVGSKTGYLDEAGYCLMTRVRTPDNKHLIIVLLGADSREQTFKETEELIQFGLLKK